MDREDYEIQIEGIDAEAFSYDGEDVKGKEDEEDLKEWLIDVCKSLSPIEEEEDDEDGEKNEAKSSSVKPTTKKSSEKKRKIDDVYRE